MAGGVTRKVPGGDFLRRRAWQSGSIGLWLASFPLAIADDSSVARVRRDDAFPRPFASRTPCAAAKCEHEASPSPDSRRPPCSFSKQRGLVSCVLTIFRQAGSFRRVCDMKVRIRQVSFFEPLN